MKQASIHDCNTFMKVLIIDTDVLYFQLFQKQVDNQHDTERYSIKGRSEPNIITILRTSVYWERERERERESM